MKRLSFFLLAIFIATISPLKADDDFSDEFDDDSIYEFNERDCSSTVSTEYFELTNAITATIGLIIDDWFSDVIYFQFKGNSDKTLQSALQNYKKGEYLMDIEFNDGTIARNCFVKVTKIVGGGTLSDILRINYYPRNYNIAPNSHDMGNEKIKAKLLAADINSITLRQGSNSYTFPMRKVLTSVTLKNLYDHVLHNDAQVTDPVSGFLSLQTNTKPSEQKPQAESTTKSHSTTNPYPPITVHDLVYLKCGLYPQQQTWEETKAILLQKKDIEPTDHDQYISFKAPFMYRGYRPTCLVMKNFTTTTYNFTCESQLEAMMAFNSFINKLKAEGMEVKIETEAKKTIATANLHDRTIGIVHDKDKTVSFMVLLNQPE